VITATALFTVAMSAGLLTTFARTISAEFAGYAILAWDTPYDLLVWPAAVHESEQVGGVKRPSNTINS
jgi:hypothetical protein